MGARKDLRTLFLRFSFVVCYCLVGAAIFYAIEHKDVNNHDDDLYNKTKTQIMRRFGINATEYESLVKTIIDASSDTPLEWTFTRGIDLCWQTMTTVGYGNKTPTTLAGQLFIIPFAMFGIPLTVFMLSTCGQNICHFIGFINKNIERKLFGRKEMTHCKVKCLLSVCVLTIALLVFMAGVSIKAEGWGFGLSLYVWFVTFTTVGFGDYIPGNGTDYVDSPIAIVYRLIFVIIGLSLISTVFNAMTDCIEEKRKKAESKSWLDFFISAFTSRRSASTGDELGSEMTTVHPSTKPATT